MNDGLLINSALSTDGIEMLHNRFGSTCKFSSTLALQQRILKGTHLRQKDFNIPIGSQPNCDSRDTSTPNAHLSRELNSSS